MANVIIQGGTFNSAHGDFHINNKESGLRDLKLGVSLGAIHDSAERFPPPNCHPDTRKVIRQIILDWIDNETSASTFFWLYGPAGAGKTAILQAIAEFLCNPSDESGQNFGGSFFFSRGKQGRDQGRFLFSTIGYQLALRVPGLRQHVNHIMELDPTLYTKSMVIQLQTLIVDAFKILSPLPQRSYLVIMDGLDECHDKADQQLILQLLCEAITIHKLPLRFLIGSRPESHIRASFDQESLYTITQRVVLDETFNPGRDIRVFLQDGFAKICNENSILSHVEKPWPSEGIIDLLVQRSSGQFIYAATVLKFVGADFCSPTKQLALVLKPDPTAFSDLDQLYTQILSVYPSAVNIVKVLGIVSASQGALDKVIEDIFEMEEGEMKLMLRGLSSLMKDENEECLNNGVIHFAHASFSDYLFDSSRSRRFHVKLQEYENQITTRSFALIMQSIRSWRMSSITRVLHTATWEYFTSRLPDLFSRSRNVEKEAIMTDINNLVQEFWRIPNDGAVGTSFYAMLRLLEILQKCSDTLKIQKYKAKFKKLFDGYRKKFDQSFSTCKSKDLGDMLRLLPGVVVQKEMSVRGMTVLYRIKPDLLARLIKSTTIGSLRPPHASLNPRFSLDDYLSGFLQDRDRSQLYYCDPMLQHISICRQFLSLLDGSIIPDPPSHDLLEYVFFHLYDHLCAATAGFFDTQNISDDHPALEILHGLEISTYCVDENSSGHILTRCIIQVILRWANMLNCRLKSVAVSVSNVDLMERVCHLTNKIYREMLCITRQEGVSIITISGLCHVQLEVIPFSSTLQYRIVLSWDLLVWITMEDRIPYSFTNFITTPELSGLLYISPDIYHTQITEFFLEKLYQSSVLCIGEYFFDPDRSIREHLSRALPTEKIFYLLRSIRSERMMRDTSGKLTSYSLETASLETIVKWLQGLDSRGPGDLYDRFQDELQHKKTLAHL